MPNRRKTNIEWNREPWTLNLKWFFYWQRYHRVGKFGVLYVSRVFLIDQWGLPWWIKPNSKISAPDWIKPKSRWPNCWELLSKQFTAMSRVGAPYHLPWSARFTFWYRELTEAENAVHPAGKPKIAHPIKKSSVLHGNSKVEISAGLSMEPSVTASLIKTGMTKWKFAAPAGYLPVIFNCPGILSGNQRPPAEVVWGKPLEGVGAALCWWSLLCPIPLLSSTLTSSTRTYLGIYARVSQGSETENQAEPY